MGNMVKGKKNVKSSKQVDPPMSQFSSNCEPNNFEPNELGFDFSQLDSENGATLRVINDNPEDENKKTVAVIVTFCSGGSYDQLFTSIKQKAIDGTKVQVYGCPSNYL